MDDLVLLKVMLDLFQSTAKAEDNIREPLWKFCKQKLAPHYQQRLGDDLLKYSVRVVASADAQQYIDETSLHRVIPGNYDEFLNECTTHMKELESGTFPDALTPTQSTSNSFPPSSTLASLGTV
ncbi:hypothetical protein MPER_14493, partial [Moniliophthora perniciosa FA553]